MTLGDDVLARPSDDGRCPTDGRCPMTLGDDVLARPSDGAAVLRHHLDVVEAALPGLRAHVDRLDGWGRRLASTLLGGGRLLVAGNGGSAAHAQHLTAELVGRYRDERAPLSALCLSAETSSLTAITNDYGADTCFERQVRAHGRPGDVFLGISTSGSSENVVQACEAGRSLGLLTLALTGPVSSPLGSRADDVLAVGGDTTAAVQELHQVVVHLLCESIDAAVARATIASPGGADR